MTISIRLEKHTRTWTLECDGKSWSEISLSDALISALASKELDKPFQLTLLDEATTRAVMMEVLSGLNPPDST